MMGLFKINKKLLRQLDFGIIVTCCVIAFFGAINILSATQHLNKDPNNPDLIVFSVFKHQLIMIIAGLVIMYLILLVDYTVIGNYANLIYWFGVFLLVLNAIMPHAANGAESWLYIGPVGLQPSEFAKIGMIIMLAKKLDEMEGNINNLKNFFVLCFYALIPMILIVKQPDMGMTMVCFFIVLGIFFVAGLDLRVIGGGLLSLVIAIVSVWNSGLIREYQKNRLISFINPEADPLKTGFQLTQAQIGIGKGGLLGSGLLKGSWARAGSTPESSTDFIFSVLGEEWGLVGGAFLLLMYGILIYKFISIARSSKDIFGSLLCVGISSIFLFSILENIGMNIGIMPITGITLPLVSYGGSSVVTAFIAIGLILNVGMRRKKINF